MGDVFGRRGFVVCLGLCLVFLFGLCGLCDCVLFFPSGFFVLFCGCWVVLGLRCFAVAQDVFGEGAFFDCGFFGGVVCGVYVVWFVGFLV